MAVRSTNVAEREAVDVAGRTGEAKEEAVVVAVTARGRIGIDILADLGAAYQWLVSQARILKRAAGDVCIDRRDAGGAVAEAPRYRVIYIAGCARHGAAPKSCA
jgi:hypothetical protein